MYELCIIGFGISGICCAREAKKNFLNYIVLDSNSELGGCWFEKAFKFTRLQSGSNFYQIPEDLDPRLPLHPNKDKILNYFRYIVKKYQIDNIKYNSYVVNCDYKDNFWEINYKRDGKMLKLRSKFIAICTGLLNKPMYPKIPCLKKFKGDIYHTSQINQDKLDTIKDKKIVIIGNGATGLDTAKYLLKENKVCILYRTPKLLSSRYLFERPCNDLITRLFLIFIRKLPLTLYNMIITFVSIFILHNFQELPKRKCTFRLINHNLDIQNLITQRKLLYYKSQILDVKSNLLKLDNGKEIEADIVIYATGFKKDLRFINGNKANILENYKYIINPKIKNCGFIGLNPSYNWTQVCYYQSKWFIKYINEEIKLPNEELIMLNIKNNFELNQSNYMEYNDLTFNSFDYCDTIYEEIYPLKVIKDIGYWITNPNY
jgi:dimethylaniline monooxygenase (N-oxide forming)